MKEWADMENYILRTCLQIVIDIKNESIEF